MGFGGLGFEVWGLGLAGFRACRVEGLGFGVFRVQVLGRCFGGLQ